MSNANEKIGVIINGATKDPQDSLTVTLKSITYEAEGIASFEFVAKNNSLLPVFSGGAHINIHLKNGLIRQYSLCGSPLDRSRYVVAVQREENGRGGSKCLHDNSRVGDTFTVSAPKNFFPLAQQASHHILIGGGIGITPLMAMIEELVATQQSFELHYCVRNNEKIAFKERLAALVKGGHASVHVDHGVPTKGLNLKKLLELRKPDCHVYFCGPSGFMNAAKESSKHWPADTVHFEHFSSSSTGANVFSENTAFKIKLKRSKLELDVKANETIVEVLQRNDVYIETSCEEGYCGTCLTRYLSGVPDHRDTVLSEADRKQFLMVCCSRSRSDELVLDL